MDQINRPIHGPGEGHHPDHHHHHHSNRSHRSRKKRKPSRALYYLLAGGGVVLLLIVVMVIRAARAPEPEARPQIQVTIHAEPEEGAQVTLEGQDWGQTPVTVSGLRPGTYDVFLSHPRYKRAHETITVTDALEQAVTIQMEPLKGFVTIETRPVGAEVFIDGEKAGMTPLLKKELPVGDHTYAIRMENYYPVEGTVSIEELFTHEIRHDLRPLEAKISVFSRPTGADIWINNLLQGKKTPAEFRLPPGQYLVSVYTPGYNQEDTIVTLNENSNETVQLEMKPGNTPQGMVYVPGGEFIMGSDEKAPDERPKRVIQLKAFYIDRFEVTNEEFKRVFPSHTYPDGEGNFPVTGVSWSQALQYAGAVGKRLPTEAEWEKAARGTDGREYPWGALFELNRANMKDSGINRPARVGQYYLGASPYNCMDMAGNAYEWVMDWYEAYPGNTVVSKDYGQIYRVLRGGSYLSDQFDIRCAARHFDRMDARRADYGFRCAKDAE
ncbi:MAG TPA: SUMF1/EgtB/PvdO family nonheme iron enzyme [Candidatus Hydrogenedentes bacterium]|nr:SUMF1/EgtB/PvdO family nonheme iron enzyme [Candidatus Hydrogenedentota bacterium]HOK88971.1 SUMF1/EgtB/PvdO family nonheme iron enzyme [Candidatus Hydrogenedentota bacterium]HPO30472.1 SUMF1/EgtB/PvdO family nonheme iron enzyme [Candidatus Hydrogenedentota bacterium]